MRNKIFYTSGLLALFFLHASVYAQQNMFARKSHIASTGYLYTTDTKWWKDIFTEIEFPRPQHSNGAYIKYEWRINKRFGIGMEGCYVEAEGEEYKGDWLNGTILLYSYSVVAKRVFAQMSYHFVTTPRFDCYTNVGLGFYTARVKTAYNPPDPNPLNIGLWGGYGVTLLTGNNAKNGIDLSAGLGMNYFFHRNLGVMIETSLHKYVLQGGIIFRFFDADRKKYSKS
jgi:hypothetical protein